MRSSRRIAPATLALLIAAAPAYAQSLAELARQEEARRATTQKAVKVLSNADLRPQDITSPSAATPGESCYLSISQARCVTADALIANSNQRIATIEQKKVEPTWRRDAGSLRTQIEKAQADVEALEAAVGDMRRSPGERKAAEQRLLQLRPVVEGLERQWERLEKSAANMRIPHEWLEPIPTLTTRSPQ